MSAEPLQLGLLGCGRVAERIHVPAIQRSRDATLAAVADVDDNRRIAIASAVPLCRSYEQIADAARENQLDGVIIATPAEHHVAHAQAVAEHGLPVLIEKPLAPSRTSDFSPAQQLAGISGWWAMMAFNRRHWPAAKQLRTLIASKDVGEGVKVRMTLRTDRAQWDAIADTADVLDDLACHQFDLLRFVFNDEIASISATWLHPQEIDACVTLRNGVVGQCTAGYSEAFIEEMTVQFPDESFTIHAGSKYVVKEDPQGNRRTLATISDRVLGVLRGRPSAYDSQLETFCRAIRAGQPEAPDLQDGLAALRATCAARTSAESAGAECVLA